jgi:hypothetical protein
VALLGSLLLGFEASLALYEAEPAPVGGSGRLRVVALVESLDGARAGAVELQELLVVALEGLLAVRRDPDEALEDVDRLQLVGDGAAGRDLDRPFPGALQQVEDLLASGRKAEERLGLQEEGPVVADVVDDGELLVVLRLAEAARRPRQPTRRSPRCPCHARPLTCP